MKRTLNFIKELGEKKGFKKAPEIDAPVKSQRQL